MDFAKYDARSAAETAQPYHIRNQHDGEPINDGDTPCCVLILGSSSRSVNAAVKAEQAASMKALKSAKTKDEEARAMEDLHESLCKAATRLVAGFSGVQRLDPVTGKLRDATASAEDVKWFMDLNFISLPHLMRGSTPITADADESPAQWLKPSFAQQVIDAANDDARFLDGTSSA